MRLTFAAVCAACAVWLGAAFAGSPVWEVINGTCPVCQADVRVDMSGSWPTEAMHRDLPGFYSLARIYPCPECRFVGEPMVYSPMPPNWARHFENVVRPYVASDEYQDLAAVAPHYWLYARLVAKAVESAGKDGGEQAGRARAGNIFFSGFLYASASYQAEGIAFPDLEYAKNPDYAVLAMRECVRCFEAVADWPGLDARQRLMGCYMLADFNRRLGRMEEAAANLEKLGLTAEDVSLNRDEPLRYKGLTADIFFEMAARQRELVDKGDAATLVKPADYVR